MRRLFFLLFAIPLLAAEPDTSVPGLIRQIKTEVDTKRAMDYMLKVYESDRWFTFPKFAETAEYVARTMREIGMTQVEVVKPPADGVTQYGYWTMPLAWDVKEARLEIVEPPVPAEQRVLADYQKVPASLGMWSGPTKPGGVTVEVVDIKNSPARELGKFQLKGKLALTSYNPVGIKYELAKTGALGAINASTENQDLKDGHYWVNAWGDNGWAFTKGSSPLVCFSITPRQAEFLRGLLAKNKRVRVKAVVDSRYYSGTYDYATGVLPGSGPGEEVLTLGHTSEIGAQDNAIGIAAMLEALGSINRLIQAGKLPRPVRSIRILAMGELYPTMHYIANNQQRIRNTVAGMCLDTGAGFYHLAGTEFAIILNPHSAKSFVDAFILRVAEAYFGASRPPRLFRPSEYFSGTDNFLGEPTVNIPTVWTYGGSGIPTHHNSEDTPDRIDPRSVRDLTTLTAVYLYYLAAAGEHQVPWLAELAATRGYQQIAAAAAPALERMATAVEGQGLAAALAEGRERVAYFVDREKQSVRSVLRMVPESRRAAMESMIAPLITGFDRAGQNQSERVQTAADRRAKAIGLPVPVRPAATADPRLAGAENIVVKRKRFGTLPLDDLAPDKREGYPAASFSGPPVTALYWCDGKRNLAEVIRLTRLESGPTQFDFVGYFRFLERKGYVEFVK